MNSDKDKELTVEEILAIPLPVKPIKPSYSIHKFPLRERVNQTMDMPRGAEILSLQVQKGIICIWAKVDTSLPEESDLVTRHFKIFGTGEPLDFGGSEAKYIGTCLVSNDTLVWHVYEILN